MSTATLSHFFAILSLVAWAGTILAIVLAIVRRLAPESSLAYLFDDLGGVALWLGWLVAAVTMAGSLYYSIGPPQYVPCELCWYQRICLYPMAVILLVGAVRRDRKVWMYVVPQLVIGAAIAVYHTQLQAFPKQQTFCQVLNPCTTRYVWEFGFVSLPFMSLAASCFIITMVLVSRATDPARAGDPDDDEPDDGDDLAFDPDTASTDPDGASNLAASPSAGAPPDQVGAV